MAGFRLGQKKNLSWFPREAEPRNPDQSGRFRLQAEGTNRSVLDLEAALFELFLGALAAVFFDHAAVEQVD